MRREQLVGLGVACGVGAVSGMTAGILVADWTPDVVVVLVALAVLAVWTGLAIVVGALAERHAAAERFDGQLDAALLLRSHGERLRLAEALARQRADLEARYATGTEALYEAVREDR